MDLFRAKVREQSEEIPEPFVEVGCYAVVVWDRIRVTRSRISRSYRLVGVEDVA